MVAPAAAAVGGGGGGGGGVPLLPAAAVGGPPSFSAVTYNILAKSLGSNTIPWVLCVSEATEGRVAAATGEAWVAWRRRHVDAAYFRDWHKNLASGDYAAFRELWGADRLVDDGDLPDSLRRTCRVVAEDEVRVLGAPAESSCASLRGLLRRHLGPDLGESLFDEIRADEDMVFRWDAARGPRVFDIASNFDLVALHEYDVDAALAAYGGGGGGGGETTTFRDAMVDAGYDGIFATDLLKDCEHASGLALYWRRDVFELATSETAPTGSFSFFHQLDSGAELEGAAWNVDLAETRTLENGTEELLKAADRRNAVLVKLRHRASGRRLAALTAHLMTSSRDNAKYTAFPGEVRAKELATLRELVRDKVAADEALVFLGDFNAAPDAAVFRGTLSHRNNDEDAHLKGARKVVDTGFREGRLEWAASTGEPVLLLEAFAEDHNWGANGPLPWS